MLSGIILLLTILVISSSVIAVNADVFKTLKLKQPDRIESCNINGYLFMGY